MHRRREADSKQRNKLIPSRNAALPQRLLYVAGFIDLFGVSLLVPLLAHEVRKYGASSTVVGLFLSLYGALQLISSPIVGQASDSYGRKFVLWFCLLGSGFGYLMLGFSHSLLLMFLSRIPTGLLKHSQAVIKAYVADVTPPQERPAVLGTLNAVCSSGFIIGPVIGGHIASSQFGFQKVAIITGLIFVLNAALVYFAIPDAITYSDKRSEHGTDIPSRDDSPAENETAVRNADKESINDARRNWFKTIQQSLSLPLSRFIGAMQQVHWTNVADIFFIRFLASLSMIIFRSSFNLILEYRFSTSPKTNGYIMSYNAILGVISGFSVRLITGLFSSTESMHRFFSVTLVFSLVSLSVAPDISYIVIALIPLCLSTSVLRVASSTLLYKKGGESEKGFLTGLSDSFMSMARMVGPTIGGIAQDFNIYGPGIVSTSIAIGAASLTFFTNLEKRVFIRSKVDFYNYGGTQF